MYSGEATVSNDILSEVLRGGEMLKIRGLCRTSSATLHHSNSQHQVTSSSHYGSSRSLSSNAQHHHGQMTGELFPASTKSSSTRFSIEQHQQQFRGLGASVMPKDSPVIIKSPKVHATNSSNSHHKHFMAPSAAVGAITINKEVAIDPEDKCCYVPAGKHHETPQMSNTFAAGNAICNELGCTNCPLSTEPASRQRSSLERHEYEEHAVTPEQHAEEIPLRYETNLRRSSHHDGKF